MEGSGGLIILQALSRHCFISLPPQAGLFYQPVNHTVPPPPPPGFRTALVSHGGVAWRNRPCRRLRGGVRT
jgi:hypothetical protein